MEIKDNAYTQTQTETLAEATVGIGDSPTMVSTDLGKFKDVSALLKAYDSLQAEFTRRSQRLKELQRQVEQIESDNAQGACGVEKLKTRAVERKQAERKFDEFVRDLERENLENDALTQTNSILQGLEEQTDGEEIVGQEREKGAFVAPKTADTISTDDLFELVSRDENVRLKVIGEYLSSLKTPKAPLMRGGAGLCVSPTMKAKSVGEAGAMALRLFKKENL